MSIHTFDNGVRVFARHLLLGQRKRYATTNIHEPEEEAVFLRMVCALPNGATLVNIGAAFGYYCILAKRKRPDLAVWAVEPLARHRAYLAENLTLNGMELAGIIPAAVAERRGQERFEDRQYSSFLPSAGVGPRRGWRTVLRNLFAAPASTVDVLTLDDVLERAGPVGLCAMDVQGAEAGAIRSYTGRVPVGAFLIGTHGPQVHGETAAMLLERGYRITEDRVTVPDQPDGMLAAERR